MNISRLDQWWAKSTNHNYADFNLGKRKDFPDDIDNFRIFDPETTDLSFWGQNFNLQDLITEVRALLPKLETETNKPHWGPEQLNDPRIPEAIRRLMEQTPEDKK